MGLHRSIESSVYGLVAPNLAPRWLAMISGGPDERPIGVTLAHGWFETPGVRWVDVTTVFNRSTPPDGWSRADWGWYDGGLEVLTRTDIDYRSTAGQAWRAAAEAFNADHEAHYRSWSAHTWAVDGQALSARSFHIDGAWAALCVALDDLVIYAHGQGVAPDNLALQSTDGTGYGVDFREPLHFPDSIKTSRAFARNAEIGDV